MKLEVQAKQMGLDKKTRTNVSKSSVLTVLSANKNKQKTTTTTTTTTSDISSRALIKPIARPVIMYLRIYDISCIYEINSVFTKLQYDKWNNL